MRWVLAICVVTVVSGCMTTLPRTWDPDTGEVDCPTKVAVAATSLAVLAPIVAVGELRFKPEPPMYDQYGYPTNVSLSPEVHHAIGWGLVGVAGVAAAVAVLEWTGHARCRRLDAPMRALMAARDCATAVRLLDEVDAIAPGFRFVVIRNEPGVASCVKMTERTDAP